jgi:hypothetical protein
MRLTQKTLATRYFDNPSLKLNRIKLFQCELINKGVFESMIIVVFQSVFHSEMHQNNIFFIF